MSTRFVALDTSTNKSGCALFLDGDLEEYRLLDFSKMKVLEERTAAMCGELLTVLDHWSPDIVYIERPKGQLNVALVEKLMRILGVVYGWTLINHKEYQEFTPSEWRRWAGIDQGKKKRAELKAASVAYVRRRYGIEVNDDVADAITLGDAAINFYTGPDDEADDEDLFG